ncbi:hypothetical protein [Pleionea mediterranea]|uniref:Thymidylate synthase n=1 Tax=Pleionea mediterranea TaxID=523701 RepID=A0A316FW80_9GAMM|nr:hypothetical protein [Pleionea mediterranea]PWK52848.1 hypothetical protein C8D97_10466 [Pleionea mediterranea]
MDIFRANTKELVWMKAIRHLINTPHKEDLNILLELTDIYATDELSESIREWYSREIVNTRGIYPIETVADTIFPNKYYRPGNIQYMTDRYLEDYDNYLSTINSNKSGTYAERILRGKKANSEECYPLLKLVERLTEHRTNSNYNRLCYEVCIDYGDAISINRNDSLTMGFPCLSHLSFKIDAHNNTLNLTALYRSHYYVTKALGNLYGLCRLLAALCLESGWEAGNLVIHSTYAKFDPEGSTRKFCEKIKTMEDSNEFD